jgi:WD40-like Beta Propeller Repeat
MSGHTIIIPRVLLACRRRAYAAEDRGRAGMRTSRALLVVTSLILLAVAPLRQAVSGTIPGANGRLAFILNPNGSPRLATSRADGHDVRVLVGNHSGYSALFVFPPQWSPDGGRILVVRDQPSLEPPHLLVVRSDGTGVTDLGRFPESFGNPSWSPSGEIIYSDAGSVYAASLDSLDSRSFLFGDAGQPVWSPDGSKIAFTRSVAGVPHIWVADADGGGQTQLTFIVKNGAGQSDPTWSPDSTRVVYQSGAQQQSSVQVGVVNVDGSGEAELTSTGTNADPVWSPDGSKIGFWSSRGHGLWTMNADGTGQVHVFDMAGFGTFDWQSQQVTLGVSKSSVAYGSTLTLSGHVVPSPPSGTVSFFRIPAGSAARSLMSSGSVDGDGNIAITFSPKASATYVVSWSGDVDHPLGGWSAPRGVEVKVRISGGMRGGYATRNGYRLYHFSWTCPNRGRSCPLSAFRVVPDQAGKRLFVTLQLHRNGAWRTASSRWWRLRETSRLLIVWVYADNRIVGLPARVRATFPGDRDLAGSITGWLRFRVTR